MFVPKITGEPNGHFSFRLFECIKIHRDGWCFLFLFLFFKEF